MRIRPVFSLLFVATAAAGVTPTATAAEPPPLDAMALLQALEHDRRIEEAGLRIDEVKLRRAEIAQTLGGQTGPQGFPTLIRLVGAPGKETAEFEHGNTRFEARRGDRVTADYRIVRTFATGVELQGADGARHVLMMGTGSLTPARASLPPTLPTGEPEPVPPPADAAAVAAAGAQR